MEVYKTEEEQVQAIKQWWKDNAFSLVAGIAIGAIVLGGYKYWTESKQNQAKQASVIYSEILSSKSDKTNNTELLKSDYSGAPYAALATLLLAKDNVIASEYDKAISQLTWVVENNHDESVEHIAIQRLARVYLSQNKISDAEKLVAGIKASGFESAYSEIRGDINLAKNLPTQAKENYRLALTTLKQGDKRYEIIKMKLDDLTQESKAK